MQSTIPVLGNLLAKVATLAFSQNSVALQLRTVRLMVLRSRTVSPVAKRCFLPEPQISVHVFLHFPTHYDIVTQDPTDAGLTLGQILLRSKIRDGRQRNLNLLQLRTYTC